MTELTADEQSFIASVKPKLEEFLELCKKEEIEPGAGTYLLSEKGNIYHGVPFEVARWIHGEENAIGSMLTEESLNARFRILLVVGAPEKTIMPCGMCRVALYKYGIEGASILCSNISLTEIEKYSISKLYPKPYEGD